MAELRSLARPFRSAATGWRSTGARPRGMLLLLLAAAATVAVVLPPGTIGAQTYEVLHGFSPERGDPNSLLVATDGNIYGTSFSGGRFGLGSVFVLTPNGGEFEFSTLWEFSGLDGAGPMGRLVRDTDGTLYGTTQTGGSVDQTIFGPGYGTVFRIDPSGSLTTLYRFSGDDGGFPAAGLVAGGDGLFYGTTRGRVGTPDAYGTIFSIDSLGQLTTLHRFSGIDGDGPFGLTLGTDLDFYGTTRDGGVSGYGSVFRIDSAGMLESLYSFPGRGSADAPPFGSSLSGGLVQGHDGAFYGTTEYGGTGLAGVVFRVDVSVSPVLVSVVYAFRIGADPLVGAGGHPSGLIVGGDDKLYGTTSRGGSSDYGTVFQIDTSGSLETVRSFSESDGGIPVVLAPGSGVDVFGATTSENGQVASGHGTIFRIDGSGSLATLYSFPDNDGHGPWAGLIQASDGDFYGTTSGFLANSNLSRGTVFRMSTSGSLTTLHSFVPGEGDHPEAGLVQGNDGKFYGTTRDGGVDGIGTVYRVDSDGLMETLYSFRAGAGGNPMSGLAKDGDGWFYGTTADFTYPADGVGTIFRIDAGGAHTTLHAFDYGIDGRQPVAGLIRGADGALLGTTIAGAGDQGESFGGTVFRLDASGLLTTLHRFDFEGDDGWSPRGELVQDTDGNLYGTTSGWRFGPVDYGTVFRIDTSGSLTTLHWFTGDDGARPSAGLIQGSDGAFYGTTLGLGGLANDIGDGNEIGADIHGTVFRIDSFGNLTTLHWFDGADGENPSSRLVQGSDRNFYGTTRAGGPYGAGVVFRVTVPGLTPVGSDVTVVNGDVTTTFSNVSSGGTTTAIPIDPETAGVLPAGGYSLSDLGIAYEISTTSVISGDITIGFVVPGSVDEVTFNSLRVLHGEGGSLIDRTYFSEEGCTPAPGSPCPAPNFATRTIYARVSSLSPFVLATVSNPFVQAIVVPADPVVIAASINVQGSFTDPGTHAAVWSWEDGTTSAGTISESAGHGTVTGSHVYTAAGVYRVTLTVTDSGGSSGQRVSPYLVIYDPAAGFVTGGGWVNSPAGAYAANPTLTGQANFGFVSKYKKNVTSPTGETEFHFSDINFHGSSHDWLVITGAKAQVQGSGTINNAGNFAFKLTVIDGQVAGGGGTDKFRIKIWDKTNGNAIVYDNQMGAPDTANPTTVIGGGSIVIH